MARPQNLEGASPQNLNFVSDVARLGDDNRVTFPARLMKLVEWFDGSNPVSMMAELVETGHVKFHHYDRLAPSIDALRAELTVEAEIDPEASTRLSVLEDRYRAFTLYQDRRVRLTEAVLVFLSVIPSERPFLFVQSSKTELEVMSLAFRNQRITKYRGSTTPGGAS